MRFFKWVRKAGQGHREIMVLCKEDGTFGEPDERGCIQCATMDRIPFAMKPTALLARYQPSSESPSPTRTGADAPTK